MSINGIVTNAGTQLFKGLPPGLALKTIPLSAQGGALPAADRVDLASFPGALGTSSGLYGSSYRYEEEVALFAAQGSLAFQGRDGTEMFVAFSVQAVTKKVQFEMVRTIDASDPQREAYRDSASDLPGPAATAGRIADFAGGLVKKFRAMAGDDPEKLAAFIKKLIQAIRKGFHGLDKILGGVPEDVGRMVQDTYDRVMERMAALEGPVGVQRITYEEEITVASVSLQVSVTA